MTNAITDAGVTTPATGVGGFLAHTRAVLREHFGPTPTGHIDRMAQIVELSIPELAELVRNGALNTGLAHELCRLPPSAQREVLSQTSIKEIRRLAESLRRLRLGGPSAHCLCCGHRVESRGDVETMRAALAEERGEESTA